MERYCRRGREWNRGGVNAKARRRQGRGAKCVRGKQFAHCRSYLGRASRGRLRGPSQCCKLCCMCAAHAWLLEFLLTWPGMALLVIVCVGNGVVCRARRAYSNAIGLTMLGVTFAPLVLLAMDPGAASPQAVKEQHRQVFTTIVAVVLLIWVPVLIRWMVDRRRPVEGMLEKPTGGFPVITTDDVDETQV